MRPIDFVRKFIELWNDNDIDAAHDMLSEDVFYHNVPMPPIRGRAATRAFARQYGIGETLFADWEILHIAESGEMVLTERIDRFRNVDGRRIAVRLMGSFKVVNGKITEWRDYFDLGELQRELAKIR